MFSVHLASTSTAWYQYCKWKDNDEEPKTKTRLAQNSMFPYRIRQKEREEEWMDRFVRVISQ